MKIWLIVLWDRHVDAVYRAAATRKRAEEIAQALMDNWWNGRYRNDWKREPDSEKANLFFVNRTFDDGPSLHIQRLEVEDQ